MRIWGEGHRQVTESITCRVTTVPICPGLRGFLEQGTSYARICKVLGNPGGLVTLDGDRSKTIAAETVMLMSLQASAEA